jgi:RHS repeat-associated protein
MTMPGRNYSSNLYRYGFNGKENDKAINEGGQDYGMRIYDTRLGKFLSVDPIAMEYPELTPYQFASNRPIEGIDLDGLEFVSKAAEDAYFHRDPILSSLKPAPQSSHATAIPIPKPTHNDNLISKPNPAKLPKKQPEVHVAMPDIFGNGHIGPKSIVQENVAIVKQNYYSAVGASIAGGPFGAAGYYFGGDLGAFKGGVVDQIVLSFGGVPGQGFLSKPVGKLPLIAPPNNGAPTISQARQLLSRALSIQGLKTPPQSFKQEWSENGYDYEARIHPPDPNAPVGSNSASNTIFRISRRLQGKDAKGQGYGWEYVDGKDNWYKNKDLKSNKNPSAANNTHIPL